MILGSSQANTDTTELINLPVIEQGLIYANSNLNIIGKNNLYYMHNVY